MNTESQLDEAGFEIVHNDQIVISISKVKTTNGKKVYVISAKEAKGGSWDVDRSYEDFELLHEWIKKVFPMETLKFPRVTYSLFASESAVTQQRQEELEKYLGTINDIPSISTCWQFRNFLGCEETTQTDPQTRQGKLYLCICEVKNLSIDCLSYFEVEMAIPLLSESNAIEKEKYNPYHKTSEHKTRQPLTWFEEFNFKIPDRRRPIRLQFWMNKLFKIGTPLGYCFLDLTALTPLVMSNKWYQLEPSPGSPVKGLSVNVKALFTPLDIGLDDNLRAEALPMFRVELNEGSYFPGEMVSGRVVLCVSKPLPSTTSGLQMNFAGFQKIFYDNEKLSHKEEIFKEHRVLWDKNGPEWQLVTDNAGQVKQDHYIFPFSFKLPDNIPPTCSLKLGNTTYRIKVFLIDGTKKNNVTQNVVVCAKSVFLPPPVIAQHSTSNVIFPRLSESITVNLKLSSPYLTIGAPVNCKVFLFNQSATPIDMINVKVDSSSCIYIDNPKQKVTRSGFVLAFENSFSKGFPVLPRTQFNADFDITIPPGAIPSLYSSMSPRILLDYQITFDFIVKGWQAQIKLPAFLCHPPKNLQGNQPNQPLPSLPSPSPSPRNNPVSLPGVPPTTTVPVDDESSSFHSSNEGDSSESEEDVQIYSEYSLLYFSQQQQMISNEPPKITPQTGNNFTVPTTIPASTPVTNPQKTNTNLYYNPQFISKSVYPGQMVFPRTNPHQPYPSGQGQTYPPQGPQAYPQGQQTYPPNPQAPQAYPPNPQAPQTYPPNPQAPQTYPPNPQAAQAYPPNPQVPQNYTSTNRPPQPYPQSYSLPQTVPPNQPSGNPTNPKFTNPRFNLSSEMSGGVKKKSNK